MLRFQSKSRRPAATKLATLSNTVLHSRFLLQNLSYSQRAPQTVPNDRLCFRERINGKNQAQPHFLNLQSKGKVATLQSLVLQLYLFALKIKKSFGNRAYQLRHLGSPWLLTLPSLAKKFQRACRQKQPEQRLFLLSAPPAPS